MLACILLNQDHQDGLIRMYRKLEAYPCIDLFILADNHSCSSHYEQLQHLSGPITDVITTDRCCSDSYLANTALRHAIQAGADYCLLIEETVDFDEAAIQQVRDFMQEHQDVVFAAPRRIGDESAFCLRSPMACIVACSPFFSHLFHPLSYRKGRFDEGHFFVKADVLPGGWTMIHLKNFCRIGLFDEQEANQHKEITAAIKARLYGMKTYVLTTCSCRIHSDPDHTDRRPMRQVQPTIASMQYILREYFHAPGYSRLLSLLKPMLYLEALVEMIRFGEEEMEGVQ